MVKSKLLPRSKYLDAATSQSRRALQAMLESVSTEKIDNQ